MSSENNHRNGSRNGYRGILKLAIVSQLISSGNIQICVVLYLFCFVPKVIGGCNCDVIYILNGTEIMKLREAD
jgi:hypothetical protein